MAEVVRKQNHFFRAIASCTLLTASFEIYFISSVLLYSIGKVFLHADFLMNWVYLLLSEQVAVKYVSLGFDPFCKFITLQQILSQAYVSKYENSITLFNENQQKHHATIIMFCSCSTSSVPMNSGN